MTWNFSIHWFIHFLLPQVCDSLTTEQMHSPLPVAWHIEDNTHKRTMQAHLCRGYEVHEEFVNIQNQPFHKTNESIVGIFNSYVLFYKHIDGIIFVILQDFKWKCI